MIVDVPLDDEDRELLIFLARRQNEGQRALTLTELRMVHEIKHGGPAGAAEAAERLRLPVADVRAAATALVEAGVLLAAEGLAPSSEGFVVTHDGGPEDAEREAFLDAALCVFTAFCRRCSANTSKSSPPLHRP